MTIMERLDACVTNMQAIANNTDDPTVTAIAVHTAGELAACRDAVRDLLESSKAIPQLHTLFSRAEDGLVEAVRNSTSEKDRNVAAGAWLVCHVAAMLCRRDNPAAG